MKKIAAGIAIFVVILVAYFSFHTGPSITNAEPQGKNIICFGDSLTAGTGASPGMDYPSQLARLIEREIINAGIPGDTTATALARLDKDVLAREPRIVLITLGGNDLMRHVPAETAFNTMRIIIERIQDTGALVILGGIQIPFYGSGYSAGYHEVSNQTGAVLIPNIFEDIFRNKDLMHDTIHPNDEGYAIMATHFQKAITPYLGH